MGSIVTAPRQTIFDQSHYLRLIEARGETIRRMVNELKLALNLSTAMDAGCGVGFFSETLRECGLQVRAFDGRIENEIGRASCRESVERLVGKVGVKEYRGRQREGVESGLE